MSKNLYWGVFLVCLVLASYNLYNKYLYPFYYSKFIYPKLELDNRLQDIFIRNLRIDEKLERAKIFLSQEDLSLIKSKCSINLKPENILFNDCIAYYKEKIFELVKAEEAALKQKEITEKQKEQENLYRMLEAYNAKKNSEPLFWEFIAGYKALQSTSNSLGGNSSNSTSPCFFKSDAKSGINKICYYNCTGSIKAKNVSITDICPLTY